MSTSWHKAFEQHSFSKEHIALIDNFHIKYECLDARDDYGAQLAKDEPGAFVSSWDSEENNDCDVELNPNAVPDMTVFDLGDVPSFLQEGTSYRKRKEQHLSMKRVLASVEWSRETGKIRPISQSQSSP